MEQCPVVQLDTPEAQRLADCTGIFRDLGFVVDAATRLTEALRQEESDSVIVEALANAALVTYVRCFATGKRFGLGEEVFSDAPDGTREVHAHYKNLRDKHVAHSVNPYEQAKVGVILSPRGQSERRVEGVAHLTMRHIAITEEDAEQLRLLARHAQGKVGAECKDLQNRLLATARQLPFDELDEAPALGLYAWGPAHGSESR